MPTTFRNSTNGHAETVGDAVWAGPLFLGVFYLAYRGLWAHVVCWLVFVGGIAFLTGGPGVIIALPIASIGYAIGIKGILESSYLKRGWIKSGSGDLEAIQSLSERQCPLCAETIKKAAVKCKHCGAEIEKDASPSVQIITDGWAVRVECYSQEELAEAYSKITELDAPSLVPDGLVAVGGLFHEKSDAEVLRRNLSSRYRLESTIRYQSLS
ncbi:zinc ribbon domain-containing protein [Pseudomonas sp. RGM 3321]|uniref:zinc ribbon domain-containing protein n=1 Tax=Pseudomonas sp. RGM 3321 TaxID=2930089 RepID=UPI001FCC5AA8|nr:zinc ribbon domain-containing protein [Pseudomonas sp. RGM 3321]MCJ2375193.1 zinc ribbon domain-containing protein [Pseudomonas sp. RGM 3321]